ncbi:MAG: radical SAM protein [Candidatus Saccharicenans sp.]|jgi:wyosine [tRNA(Phe)-imidazoG37] synthetase (radical SAM superfamily)|nr:radical SAM protein [Candidatus Saccharicenans sp.]MDH7575843.1 radical SAM protein [Candidatus Saccharicenans sp.]
MNDKRFPHLYGPVPSRRLGYSLGVDLLPFKTCSLSCVYCQLGRTRKTTIRRGQFFSAKQILQEVQEFLKSGARVDFITFSGSGEPTLNKSIGWLIRKIKKMSGVPVAVLTNSTLLSRPEVRKELAAADVVVPSLDAASQEVFEKVNRPHPSLRAEKIIEGLVKFRRQFKGKIWLEILLVKGINDSPAHLKKLKAAVEKIKPDKIHLNTVVRPPAESQSRPLSPEEMEKIKEFFGEKAEVVASFRKKEQEKVPENIVQAILSIVRRRPVSLEDLEHSLGLTREELSLHLQRLMEQKRVRMVRHLDRDYFEPA